MCQLCIEDSLQSWDRYDAAPPGVVPGGTTKTVWSTSQVINQLDSGYNWSGNTITYAFAQNANFFPYSEANDFSPFNAAQRAAGNAAIELWDDLIAPSFVRQSDAGSSDIKFSNTTTSIGYAHAYLPGGWSGAGSVWLNNGYGSLADPDVGESGFMTILHELGHALGLNHAGNYNGGSPTYQDDASHAQDSQMFTIMSYFGAENTGADWQFSDGSYAYAQTPMVHDVLAIQAAYGADTTTRTGNTVYGFNSNAGNDIFDFTTNQHPVLTIWDAGGTDTLDLSGSSDPAIINLAPGSYSDAFGAVNNLAIAYGTWIENAMGGSNGDVITGNARGNVVRGNGGRDTIFGGGGRDKLSGQDGRDKIAGQNGNDKLYGQNGNDRLYGQNGNDKLYGGNANDKLFGGIGKDKLNGGGGKDKLVGGDGVDTFLFRAAAWGQDTITDFENGLEKMDMRGSGATASTLHVVNSGGNAVVDFGGADTITLIGEAGNISANDFIF